MNELIKVTTNAKNEQIVSARELHQFLEVSKPVTQWFEYQAERAMLLENEDFITILLESTGGRPSRDYAIKLSAAKELAMLNGGEKGKQARLYFIECEKKLMNIFEIPQTYSQALMLAAKQAEIIEQQNIKIELDAPKVEFAEQVMISKDSIDMGTAAKVMKTGIGRNKLFEILREHKVLNKDNIPYQKYIDSGDFEIEEKPYKTKSSNNVKISIKTLVTGKGQERILRFLKKNNII
jgi:anti-repressor protein